MGRGSYTAADWTKLRNSFGNDRSAEKIYGIERSSYTSSLLVNVNRESRDNEDQPESTPIIIGFDVTASMGYLAEELALNSLNKAIMYLYDNKPISCPQVMCCAVGDCKSDKMPLQVTQFESDIRIIKQLTSLKLEGGGGGNGGESYNLVWYFAANHTNTDCYERRNKKGILITIGDDCCHKTLSCSEVSRVFGDKIKYDLSDEELVSAAEKMYSVFHICIDKGNIEDDKIFNDWRHIMNGRVAVINKREIIYLSELIYSLISIAQGKNNNETLASIDQRAAEIVSKSLSYISIQNNNNTISF